MSEATHTPPPHPDGRAAPEHPEVAFEPRDANIRVIVITGVILVVVAVAIHLLLWWMFDLLQAHHNAVKEVSPPLVRQEANQPPQGPPLEGIQARDAALSLRGDDGKVRPFAIDGPIPVARGGKTEGPNHKPLTVFDLDWEKEAVTVVYETPRGQETSQDASTAVSVNRVVTVLTPPEQVNLPAVTEAHRLAFTGHIVQVVAISPEYRHYEAEAELNRGAGWVKGEEDKVAHIPLDKAMDLVAQTSGGGKAGKPSPPNDARPGGASRGGRP